MAKIFRAALTAMGIRRRDRRYWNWYLYHHI